MIGNATKSRRIVVYRIGELGDTIVALPSLWAVRRSFPDAHIALLGNVNLVAQNVSARQVLPQAHLIDQWLAYQSTGDRGPADLLSLLIRLRRLRFDTLIYLAPRIRKPQDVRRDLLFFRLAGIRDVMGDRGFEPLPPGPDGGPLPVVEHEADHLLRRLSLSGISVPPPGSVRIDLALTGEEQNAAELWLHEHVPAKDNLVGFGPGSKWPSKIWPEERFAELGRRLIAQCGIYPIVFGGANDREVAERLIGSWGRGANAAGTLPVRPAATALARCRLYVGNDTGTMHLAAAVGTPCVVTMSALDWPGHWNPYGWGHTVLRRSVPCEGCLLKVCEREAMRCLKEISVDEVLSACTKTLLRAEPLHLLAFGNSPGVS